MRPFQVGDEVEFEIGTSGAPLWNFDNNAWNGAPSGRWGRGTVVKIGEYLGFGPYMAVEISQQPRLTYDWPLRGHRSYAPNRPGWVRLVTKSEEK